MSAELPKEELLPFEKTKEPLKETQNEKPLKSLVPIPLKDGLVDPTDLEGDIRICKGLLDSGALPQQFENVQQVFMARQMLRELNFPPTVGIRSCMIVNGALSVFGDLPLAIVRRSGLLEGIDERIYNEKYEEICFANKNLHTAPFYGVCKVKRKDKQEIECVFSWSEAKTAGLIDKKMSVWKSYPKRMLQMRARSQALKDEFSDALYGVAITEYDYDMLPGANGKWTAQNDESLSKELNETYAGETEKKEIPQDNASGEV